MADYAMALACVDEVLGTEGLDHYRQLSDRTATDTLDHPFIAALIRCRYEARGVPAKDILSDMNSKLSALLPPPAGWPKGAQSASGQLTARPGHARCRLDGGQRRRAQPRAHCPVDDHPAAERRRGGGGAEGALCGAGPAYPAVPRGSDMASTCEYESCGDRGSKMQALSAWGGGWLRVLAIKLLPPLPKKVVQKAPARLAPPPPPPFTSGGG